MLSSLFPSLPPRNPASGAWRGVRISGDVLHPPSEGWSNVKYVVVSKPVSVSAEERIKEESGGSSGSYREREPIDLGERGRRG